MLGTTAAPVRRSSVSSQWMIRRCRNRWSGPSHRFAPAPGRSCAWGNGHDRYLRMNRDPLGPRRNLLTCLGGHHHSNRYRRAVTVYLCVNCPLPDSTIQGTAISAVPRWKRREPVSRALRPGVRGAGERLPQCCRLLPSCYQKCEKCTGNLVDQPHGMD
jgi:hypothetical protein